MKQGRGAEAARRRIDTVPHARPICRDKPRGAEHVIDLYAAGTSNGMRAKIMLEECGLAYKLHPIDLTKGENKTREFLALNPMAQIPVIVDSEGPGGKPVTLAQSIAILIYLAEKSGKFMPKEGAKRAAFWQALMNAATDMGPTLGSVFTIARSAAPHKPSQEMFETRFKQYLKTWDESLAKQKYCGGDEVTIADFALYAVYGRCKGVVPALVEGYPNLDRWAAEIGSRPGVKKGMSW
jgi:GST-like protein